MVKMRGKVLLMLVWVAIEVLLLLLM
uniref:Uncharacterized protein n=1 Tax=Anopheles christyi TaxID=43041 RepID=A0A182KHS2_9DIPT